MKIYELIKNINKKVTIKTSRVLDVKKHYISLYRANMVYLYDKGYISDPTVFDTKEILGNIVDLNIKYLTGVTGRIELSEDYIGYAICKYKDNEEVLDFLNILLNVVRYRNMSINIDKFYDDLGFANEVKNKVSLNVVQSASRIFNKNGFNLNESILRCFKPYGVGFKLITLDDIIYSIALSELGITDESDSSLFVEGLTREEEIRYSHLILNGLVKLDGVYADKLNDWLSKNKWAEGNKFSSQNEGLYNWVLYIKSNIMIEEQSVLLNKLLDEGNEIVCMQSNGFYVIDSDSPLEFPVGLFAVVSDEDDGIQLPEINKLEGYTGELYSLEYLESHELEFVGSPIELYVDAKKKELFVDKEQTELKDSISWFKHMDARLSFDESTYREGVFPQDSLEDSLYKIVCDSESGCLIGYLTNDEKGKNIDSIKKQVAKKL
ncbi:hypothetical protein ACEE21_14750 [Clostridium baratii]